MHTLIASTPIVATPDALTRVLSGSFCLLALVLGMETCVGQALYHWATFPPKHMIGILIFNMSFRGAFQAMQPLTRVVIVGVFASSPNLLTCLIGCYEQSVVAHALSPNTQEAEKDRALWFQGQPRLYSETPISKKKKKTSK